MRILKTKTTSNYDAFAFMSTGNRIVDKAHVKNFERKLQVLDLSAVTPILTWKGKESKGKLFIAEGQHRYQACKNLGKSIKHNEVKCTYKQLEELIYQLNSGNKKHTLEDKLKIGRDNGNKTIRKVYNLQKSYAPHISIGTVAMLLFSFGRGGQVKRALERRAYKINYETEFKKLVKFIDSLSLPEWKWGANFVYVMAKVQQQGKKAIGKAKYHPWTKCSTTLEYKEQFYDCTGVRI